MDKRSFGIVSSIEEMFVRRGKNRVKNMEFQIAI